MTESDSSKSSEGATGTDAGEWAKAVVDGMPKKAGQSTPPPAAPLGNVTPDESVASRQNVAPDEIDTPDDVLDAVDAAVEAEAAEAEVVEAEVIDAEVIDAEVVDAEAEPADPEPEPAAAAADGGGGAGLANETKQKEGEPISVEDLVIDLERVTTERDQYLDASRRLQAEFENYKKQVAKRESQARERANDSLISELLPVMDAFDGAIANGADDVVPMRTSFLDALSKQGLERIDPGDDPFDPNLHEAVMHDDDADTDGPVVAEVMRAGYVWKGRVLRPAMVRTRG